jgi:response regulator RpfG family c-di-GMP phosphodiesterase
MGSKPGLLLVDDEPLVLEGLSRIARSRFDVRTATSGAAGLQILGGDAEIAIVVSDMRMPVMNGAVFLAKARALAPNTVRLLLTGQADIDDAMAAINEGSIFRFLRKPCPAEMLMAALAAATEQSRLIAAERELLEQTLRGSIQALTDTLALASPGVFGIATRVARLATSLATALEVPDRWQVEIAAMVCQLGAICIPGHVFERRARHDALTVSEREMLAKIPATSERLIAHIPRLEGVREIVRYSRTDFDARGPLPLVGASMPLGARILRVALDLDEELLGETSRPSALARLSVNATKYDSAVLAALRTLCEGEEEASVEVSIVDLTDGMVMASDIRTKGGVLLVARGHEVTPGLRARLENFGHDLAARYVSVHQPRARLGRAS